MSGRQQTDQYCSGQERSTTIWVCILTCLTHHTDWIDCTCRRKKGKDTSNIEICGWLLLLSSYHGHQQADQQEPPCRQLLTGTVHSLVFSAIFFSVRPMIVVQRRQPRTLRDVWSIHEHKICTTTITSHKQNNLP